MRQRYFIELFFNGKNYHGWQIQENAVSVQGALNSALSILLKETVETVGCGRTDTGVHARQFFAHVNADLTQLKSGRPTIDENNALQENLKYHLNRILPSDIAVKRVFPVSENAHARFDATSRTYEYLVYNEKNPFLLEHGYYIHDKPDIKKMNEAATLLYNYTDFSCFSKSNTQVFTNNCTIIQASWSENEDCMVFTIEANRFLRNMVRAIVGTLLEVGRNKINLLDFIKIIEGKNRSDAGLSVPATGLSLTQIKYPYL